MEKILVSDAGNVNPRIAYIYNALASYLPDKDVRLKFFSGGNRCAIALEERAFTADFLRLALDVFTEAVAIGCKYDYLKRRLPLQKLSDSEREIFLCALIAADLPAEEGYIRKRISHNECCALDGFFSFRLRALKEKWNKIISYIPPDFSRMEMERFMHYFVDGNCGRVYVQAGEVYDNKYRLCRRSNIFGAQRLKTEAEILLSGAKEVHLNQGASKSFQAFLQKYYGAHTVFYNNL